MLASQAAEQSDVAALAAKLHENMVTWLPLDVTTNSVSVTECQQLGADIARLAAEAAEKTLQDTNAGGLAAADQALEELRALDASLPQLNLTSLGENQKYKLFAANRMTEVATLIT